MNTVSFIASFSSIYLFIFYRYTAAFINEISLKIKPAKSDLPLSELYVANNCQSQNKNSMEFVLNALFYLQELFKKQLRIRFSENQLLFNISNAVKSR